MFYTATTHVTSSSLYFMNYKFLPLCKKYTVYEGIQIRITKHANLTANLF